MQDAHSNSKIRGASDCSNCKLHKRTITLMMATQPGHEWWILVIATNEFYVRFNSISSDAFFSLCNKTPYLICILWGIILWVLYIGTRAQPPIAHLFNWFSWEVDCITYFFTYSLLTVFLAFFDFLFHTHTHTRSGTLGEKKSALNRAVHTPMSQLAS